MEMKYLFCKINEIIGQGVTGSYEIDFGGYICKIAKYYKTKELRFSIFDTNPIYHQSIIITLYCDKYAKVFEKHLCVIHTTIGFNPSDFGNKQNCIFYDGKNNSTILSVPDLKLEDNTVISCKPDDDTEYFDTIFTKFAEVKDIIKGNNLDIDNEEKLIPKLKYQVSFWN